MFKKILVANRGEIALRVMRTCREMGIATVAVYSTVDRNMLHVRYADEAYCIGEGPPLESYLNIQKIIDAAKHAGADAIHPGYGFLSERTEFSQACADNSIKFIGPKPESVRLLGDKVSARQTMIEAGVPVVPGTPDRVNADDAVRLAPSIGFPLLIKAAAGGGGKGIRHVGSPEEIENAVRIASSEAQSAFGDGGVFLERYLSPVRHVEIQVLADSHGNAVALGERECSVQRRHQKLLEESPSTVLLPETRQKMMAAGVAAVQAARYENAGTVEFLFEPKTQEFFFLEVNTRLQVEHPVTEWLCGRDLVRDQIRVAAGEPLGYMQDDIKLRGAAIECRIAAEDPYNNYLPSLGRIDFVSEPSGPGVRVDSSIFSGIEIPYFYDPMLAKLICWAQDRNAAIERTKRALSEYIIVGVQTNIPFHLQLLDDPRFVAGEVHTGFLDSEFKMNPVEHSAEDDEIGLLVAAILSHGRRNGAAAGSNGAAPAVNGWSEAGRQRAVTGSTFSQQQGQRWRRSTG
ncbi:MAG TPA: acetyl-CoA carboxylase biotin carboxylase subunit [Dehalococcoidia bacterium]|nr:acetyl-CoA carboxylase biotin carboxylase subunit [Dehalococcoidia bacterium]